ncbi:MAG: hypothetical protein ACI8ZB_001994 [Desulforhopalus sp.]|jgi:hypothetical protein
MVYAIVCWLSIITMVLLPASSYRIMTRIIRQSILKVSELGYVRSAIQEQADLSAFKEKPTVAVLAGVFAIGLSFIMGWPAIAGLGVLAIKLQNPWIVAVGGPLSYGLSHLVFLLGMYLSGAKYSLLFFRWLTKVSMEKLLVWSDR